MGSLVSAKRLKKYMKLNCNFQGDGCPKVFSVGEIWIFFGTTLTIIYIKFPRQD